MGHNGGCKIRASLRCIRPWRPRARTRRRRPALRHPLTTTPRASRRPMPLPSWRSSLTAAPSTARCEPTRDNLETSCRLLKLSSGPTCTAASTDFLLCSAVAVLELNAGYPANVADTSLLCSTAERGAAVAVQPPGVQAQHGAGSPEQRLDAARYALVVVVLHSQQTACRSNWCCSISPGRHCRTNLILDSTCLLLLQGPRRRRCCTRTRWRGG